MTDDMDSLFASLEAAAEEIGGEDAAEGEQVEEGEAAPEWVPPYVIGVELPTDASIALDELVASLQQFTEIARSFLDSDHLDVASIAHELQPLESPDDLETTEEQLAAWGATVDGRTVGFVELMALVEASRQTVSSYVDRMSEVFSGAPPPPEPPPPPAPPEEEPPPEEPALSPV